MASGLVRSFREYVPGHQLMVYGDGPVYGTDVHYLSISHDRLGLLELNIKTASVAAVSASSSGDVCWVDCDQLVLDDLTTFLVPDKLNVVGYGFGTQQRNIGCGAAVAQKDYVISGLFSMPTDIVAQYAQEAARPAPPAEGYDKLIEQELVNRLALKFSGRAHRLDLAHPSSVFGFVGGAHPGIGNAEFCSMERRADRGWWIGDKRVATAAFTADCLRAHLACGFDSFTHKETRDELLRLYKQG